MRALSSRMRRKKSTTPGCKRFAFELDGPLTRPSAATAGTDACVTAPPPSCICRWCTTGEALADTYTCIGSRAHSVQRALERVSRRWVHPSGVLRHSNPTDNQEPRLRSLRNGDNCCAPRRAFRTPNGQLRFSRGTCAVHRRRNLLRHPVPTRVG